MCCKQYAECCSGMDRTFTAFLTLTAHLLRHARIPTHAAVGCHTLLLTGRAPSKLLVSRSMGTITHADLISTYDSRFQLERGHETVPFRLTRNMQSFIGPQGMEGMVVCAITAAAQALQAEQGTTASIVALFFRWAVCLVARGRACRQQT